MYVSGNQVENSGFSATVEADDTEDFSGRQLQRIPVHGQQSTEGLGEPRPPTRIARSAWAKTPAYRILHCMKRMVLLTRRISERYVDTPGFQDLHAITLQQGCQNCTENNTAHNRQQQVCCEIPCHDGGSQQYLSYVHIQTVLRLADPSLTLPLDGQLRTSCSEMRGSRH